jgi:hypothetical protein
VFALVNLGALVELGNYSIYYAHLHGRDETLKFPVASKVELQGGQESTKPDASARQNQTSSVSEEITWFRLADASGQCGDTRAALAVQNQGEVAEWSKARVC